MKKRRGGVGDNIKYRTIELAHDRDEVMIGSHTVPLTPEEHRVLEVMLEESGSVVTRTALMLAVWDSVTPETRAEIDAIVRNLSSKLEGSGVIITTVPGIGYMLD